MSALGRPRERRFADRGELAEALASAIAADLERGVAERGAATLVVSGGRTPRPFFGALRERPVSWASVAVTLADERWVGTAEPASNEAMVRRELLRGAAAAARFVGLKTPAATPEEGRGECEARLAELLRPFDAVVLGMGGDGHTASLFPRSPELACGLDPSSGHLCLAIRPPSAPHPRITLTLPAILDARRLVLHITGGDKWEVYERALAGGPAEELPIRAVLKRAAAKLEVYWAP